ncbi:DUF3499 domain-containing protein [Boudabousia tangfeifanii]|uniref:DUF3499 domain-containing protein n=1 Tax=Boudabousia tangfeifanii TaxID=1912795 RepID=UPI0009F496F3|nr:DUF3499 domain-containing protein [Boudabousia tangfeifanii]
MARVCSKSACNQLASVTLTYDYAQSTAVIGHLATQATPGAYDLCEAHAINFTAPHGWEIIRLVQEYPLPQPLDEDFEELSAAVKEAALRAEAVSRRIGEQTPESKASTSEAKSKVVSEGKQWGHLRVVDGMAD